MFPAFYIMFFGLPVTWQLKGWRVECCGRWISRSRICVGVGNEAEAAVSGFRPSDSRVNAPISAKEIFQGTPLPQQANKKSAPTGIAPKGPHAKHGRFGQSSYCLLENGFQWLVHFAGRHCRAS